MKNKLLSNKFLTILLSVAIAFGLWLYVITYEYSQIQYTFYNVEVQMLGESVLQDRGLMIASISNRTVDLTISGKRPVAEAIITSGGIKVSEIDPKTMQSKKVPGLYFAGEIIDCDAYTGGFNLQIAWATAYAVGMNV